MSSSDQYNGIDQPMSDTGSYSDRKKEDRMRPSSTVKRTGRKPQGGEVERG